MQQRQRRIPGLIGTVCCVLAGCCCQAADMELLVPNRTTVTRHYQVRLMRAMGSESQKGQRFLARVVGPVGKHRAGELPANTLVHGRVRRVQPVGFGIRRERAAFEVEFQGCSLPWGEPLDCRAELTEIDNARERVTRPNAVQGIVAASHPHSWMSGVWLRPTPALFGRSTLGLTGASGMVQTRLLASPVAALGVVGARAVLFRLPEPEIRLPAGTDLILKIAAPPPASKSAATVFEPVDLPPANAELLQNRTAEVSQADGQKVADVVNFAFLGSRQVLDQAFAAAGWTEAKALTARTFARTYGAFASMHTYKAAPVSPLTYEGRLPDVVFQKSFNTLAKRHHIRIWSITLPDGETLWLGAATHDIGIAFDWTRLSLSHRIDLRIDRERNLLVNDLSDAGCVGALEFLERPEIAADAKAGAPRTTDGQLAMLRLRPCIGHDAVPEEYKRRNPLRLLTRRIVLETRHYITRGNPYYYAFRAIRWSGFNRSAPPGEGE